MSNKVQGGQTPDVVGQGTPQAEPSDLQAQLDEQGAPPVDPASLLRTPVQAGLDSSSAAPSDGVDQLLARAGLQAGDANAVKDVAVGTVQDVTKAAAELTGSDGLAIAAPTPPRIELNEDMKVGAEVFAGNMDQVVNELFIKGAEALASVTNQPIAKEDGDGFDAINELFFSGKLFDSSMNGDAIRADAQAALAESQDGISRDDAGRSTTQSGPTLGFATPTDDNLAKVYEQLAGPGGVLAGAVPTKFGTTGMPEIDSEQTLADVAKGENVRSILAGSILQTQKLGGVSRAGASPIPGVAASDVRKAGDLSADMLLALFLKLNITDPNNSVETHNKLSEMGTELRQQSIDESQKKSANAQVALKEAQAYAEKAEMIGMVINIIMIIIAIVVTVFSFGAAAPAAIAGVTAGMTAIQAVIHVVRETISLMIKQAVNNIVQTIVIALITMVLQIMNAVVQKTASDKSTGAAEKMNGVERARKEAERMQQLIEDENAIMKTIMESKNQMVDSVIKMLNAMFSTQSKVMSAGMSR